jgi:peptidoglycan/xylan/chitin deacetylase (PgdA/CDA1 family)
MTEGAERAAGRGGRTRLGPTRIGTAAGAVAGLALAAAAVTHAGPGITALAPVRRRLFPRLSGLGQAGHVALTFDDGPDPATTPAFLDLLAAHRLRATFFLLGSMVVQAPWLAADIADAGHELGVHGWDHKYTVLRGPRAVRDDLARAREAVAAASGTQPRFYRPPYGVLSAGALAASHAQGLTPVLWTCWGREWTAGATASSVYSTLAGGLAPGATVLLHDSDCTSPAGASAAALGALPRLFDLCAERNLRVGPLADHGLGL